MEGQAVSTNDSDSFPHGVGLPPDLGDAIPFKYNEAGRMHNSLVAEYYKTKKNTAKNADQSVYEELIAEGSYEQIFVESGFIDNSFALQEANKVIRSEYFIEINKTIQTSIKGYVNNDFNANAFIADLRSKDLLTDNMALVFEKFYSIYNESENISNIDDVSQFYAKTIEESTLSIEEKRSLILAFSVAMESPRFWAIQN